MNLADKLGFGPQRGITALGGGNFLLKVTPPTWSGFGASTIQLTEDQVKRFEAWLKSNDSIQDVFPELSAAQREIILSGIGPEEFTEFAAANDED